MSEFVNVLRVSLSLKKPKSKPNFSIFFNTTLHTNIALYNIYTVNGVLHLRFASIIMFFDG